MPEGWIGEDEWERKKTEQKEVCQTKSVKNLNKTLASILFAAYMP